MNGDFLHREVMKPFFTHVAVVISTGTDEAKRNFFNDENILRTRFVFVRIVTVIVVVFDVEANVRKFIVPKSELPV